MSTEGRAAGSSDSARAAGRPHPAVLPMLVRDHVGFTEADRTFNQWLLPPPTAITVIINVADAFGGLPQAFVAGLDDTYSVVDLGGPVSCVDVKLTPLGAFRLFGIPMSELAGRTVDLGDLVGEAGRRLLEAVGTAPSWERRFELVDQFPGQRAAAGVGPAPEVARSWRRLVAARGQLSIGQLAADVGWSHKHLIAKFKQQVGLAPRTVARVIRFNALLSGLEQASGPVRWSAMAVDCGYYDQAHLDRDFRQFAGTTPTDFLIRRAPGGSLVRDGVKAVQDTRRAPSYPQRHDQ